MWPTDQKEAKMHTVLLQICNQNWGINPQEKL